MKSIDDFSDDELEEVLKQRKQKAYAKPTRLKEIDFGSLIELCQEYVDDLEKHGYVDDDVSHYIFEAAMQSVFGFGVWDWINRM